ncbi:hypothetical protein ARZXY2_655 [Arthrobacter sp. ZXY-2]|nr:hypothetical protein ARZXY2_655 [Arthrobacter sp. ZXY-2]
MRCVAPCRRTATTHFARRNPETRRSKGPQQPFSPQSGSWRHRMVDQVKAVRSK